jgi:phage/plasmid-associated DNA primase
MPLRFALWFSGNHLPRFRDPDGALRRRTIIFECERSISEAEQKRGYAEALFRDEGPAILASILEARKDYLRESRFIIPLSVLANRDTYFDSEDKLLQFVNEQCMFGAELMVSKQRFYEAYRSWCKDGSQYPEGRNSVYEKLRTHKKLDQLGVKLDKKHTAEADGKYIHVVSGLRLKAVHELCDDET